MTADADRSPDLSESSTRRSLHELRNVLQVIRLQTQVIEKLAGGEISDSSIRILQRTEAILNQVDLAADILQTVQKNRSAALPAAGDET